MIEFMEQEVLSATIVIGDNEKTKELKDLFSGRGGNMVLFFDSVAKFLCHKNEMLCYKHVIFLMEQQDVDDELKGFLERSIPYYDFVFTSSTPKGIKEGEHSYQILEGMSNETLVNALLVVLRAINGECVITADFSDYMNVLHGLNVECKMFSDLDEKVIKGDFQAYMSKQELWNKNVAILVSGRIGLPEAGKIAESLPSKNTIWSYSPATFSNKTCLLMFSSENCSKNSKSSVS